MWSKRLADIRPITVISYSFLLIGLGYLRVSASEIPEMTFTFMARDYYFSAWVKWLLPIVVAFSSITVNWLLTEVFQVLKRYSYIGFLWGLTHLVFADFRLVILSTLGMILFTAITRLQGSKRHHANYLDIGLYIGLLTLVDIQFLAMYPLSWILLLAYGRLRWRAIFISIWGWVTIQILTASICWGINEWETYVNMFHFEGLVYQFPPLASRGWLVITTMWWLVSLQNYFIALTRANIVKRQSLSALLILQIGTLVLAISGLWSADMALAVFPIGTLTFVANDLQYRPKRWRKEVVFWSYLLIFAALFFLDQAF